MNDVKKQKATAVFCAIGMIDDSIVHQCQAPLYFKRKTAKRKLAIAAAVAACVALTITLSALSAALSAKLFFPTKDEVAQPTLEQTLINAEANAKRQKAEELQLFGGKASIIWQQNGEGDYFVLDVGSDTVVKSIRRELEREGALLPPDAESPDIKVWISYGDGSVVSPYLKNTAGNIGYGRLFDYSAEVLPSEGLAELVDGLLSA